MAFNWGVTSHVTTREQLYMGVRHFDFRAMEHIEHPGEIYFAHSLYGTSAEYEMEIFKKFANSHPTEVSS